MELLEELAAVGLLAQSVALERRMAMRALDAPMRTATSDHATVHAPGRADPVPAPLPFSPPLPLRWASRDGWPPVATSGGLLVAASAPGADVRAQLELESDWQPASTPLDLRAPQMVRHGVAGATALDLAQVLEAIAPDSKKHRQVLQEAAALREFSQHRLGLMRSIRAAIGADLEAQRGRGDLTQRIAAYLSGQHARLTPTALAVGRLR